MTGKGYFNWTHVPYADFPSKTNFRVPVADGNYARRKSPAGSEIAGWARERFIRRILNPFVLFSDRLSAHLGSESEVEESTVLEKLLLMQRPGYKLYWWGFQGHETVRRLRKCSEWLNIKQCLDQGVNHASRIGGHLVFLPLQTVPAVTIGVCRPGTEVWMPEACQEPALSPGLWLAWRQAHRRNHLPPILKALKLWMGWKAAGNPAQFLCWQALGEEEVTGEAVART